MLLKFPKNIIKSQSHIKIGNNIKIVLLVKYRTYNAALTVNNIIYQDSFNDEEPFDRHTHVFYIPENELKNDTVLEFSASLTNNSKIKFKHYFQYGNNPLSDINSLLSEYDHGLVVKSEEVTTLCEGIIYIHRLYYDNNNAPVHVHITKAKMDSGSLYIGTPDDGYNSINVRATIPDMIEAACRSGKNIIAGVNADFFDIFGDFHPSGLCIKNGTKISVPKNGRYFIAKLNNGENIITNENENPEIIPEIQQAASGYQLIVKDGQLNDFAPNEPFSFVRHPRTGAGLCKDGTILLFVVDGRIPEHSNGASLVDLAKLMIAEGADRAVNMDGGGSSAMYIKQNGEFSLKNRPADLFRPKANLIRKDFNSLLIEKI